MKRLLQGEDLKRRAKELGVDTTAPPFPKSVSGGARQVDDAELQRRVLDAERSIRESKLWLIALISAIAALLSAAAAWLAVAIK